MGRGLAALVVATVDRALERRSALAHLSALGTPARTIRSALALQTLPVSLANFAASGAAAVLGGSSYLRWDDPAVGIPIGALGRLGVLAVAAAIIATAAALAGTVVHPRQALLRHE